MKSLPILRPFLLVCACLALLASGLRAADAKPALPRLVDLGAGKCIPCKMMKTILDELTKEYAGQLDVVFIDVWENRAEGPRYGIRLIPTQIFYGADGKELARHEGFFAKKDILAKWKKLGLELKEPAAPKGN
jgi:thioredoxin 1